MTRPIGTAELLTGELKTARRGPGLHHPAIQTRIGPALRAACGVEEGEPASAVRAKVSDRLRRAADELPEEASKTALAALGLHPAVHELVRLQDRVEWLAITLRRDVRTARRRVDDACARLAEVLSAAGSAGGGPPGHCWHVQSFDAVALFDGDRPMTLERRLIVADRDGLDRIVLGWSLPVQPDGRDLDVRVLYGGVLVERQQQTATRVEHVLELPTPLRIGDRHDYSVLTHLPADRLLKKHYAYTPYTACGHFDLRVRFDRKRLPGRIWRVAGAFHRELDERLVEGEPLAADRSGEVRLQFDDLLPGYGYGVQWS
ncbi:MAG TPA: hypothetical protein VFR35_10690 [Actinoplanes sp.]|nr:hypothetical protein [Actinoplanes sp.]